MSMHALLLLSCMHSLRFGLDLGSSLDRREGENARVLHNLGVERLVEVGLNVSVWINPDLTKI